MPVDEFLNIAVLDRITAFGVLAAVAIAVITRRLVWHTDLKKMEASRDRWQQIAIDSLTLGAHAGVRAAEVAVGVVSAIPDPEKTRLEQLDRDSS